MSQNDNHDELKHEQWPGFRAVLIVLSTVSGLYLAYVFAMLV